VPSQTAVPVSLQILCDYGVLFTTNLTTALSLASALCRSSLFTISLSNHLCGILSLVLVPTVLRSTTLSPSHTIFHLRGLHYLTIPLLSVPPKDPSGLPERQPSKCSSTSRSDFPECRGMMTKEYSYAVSTNFLRGTVLRSRKYSVLNTKGT
jgi:hypothetical protein